jgi:microcystin-dependent protein
MYSHTGKTRIPFVKIGILTAAIMASSSGHACSSDPFISSVCLMAASGGQYQSGFSGYVPANGQLLNVSQYQALFALLGTTYGGNGSTNFNLPNLQGRVVVGTGTNPTTGTRYAIGAFADNQAAVQLTAVQLPAHAHPLSAAASPIAVSNGTISLNFAANSFTTSLSGVTATINGNDLKLNGSSGGTLSNNPGSSSLGTTSGATERIYSSAAPSISMQSGSISGTAPVTFSGNPTTTVNGTPTAAQGPTTATISGTTGTTGAGQAFNIMPSYLAMTYYIATQGLWPSVN